MMNKEIREKPDQKKAGSALVFSFIQQNAPVARIDIAKKTGLSPATVTSITAELMGRGLVSEVQTATDQASGRRGRPRVDLKVCGEAHLVAGMKLSDKLASVVLMDFEGHRVADHTATPPRPVLTPSEAVAFLQQTLNDALSKVNLSLSDLSGVGLGMPGLIDANEGVVHWSPSISERNVALEAIFEEALGIRVFIDNDANLVAKAEQMFGAAKNVDNFLVVTVEQGVGMGIVVDGQLYRGSKGRAAELGHTKVHLDGALCRCGQRGCLEAYVGDYALLREASTARVAMQGDNVDSQMKSLLEAADSGNETARGIILRSGRMFAMGLGNIVNIFAPELIILSSERMQKNAEYIDAVIEEMQQSVVQIGGPAPEVQLHKWDVHMWALGAAAYAVDRVTDLVLSEPIADAV